MTSPPPREVRGRRSLALAQVGPGSLRHPADGWQLARPRPLGPRATAVLHGLVDVLCPGAPAPRSPALLGRVEHGARVFLSYMHPAVALGLVVGILFLDVLPILGLQHGSRLTRLPRQEASRLLDAWARSPLLPLRLLIRGARSLVLSLYFDQSEVHERIGYAPVPFLAERVRRREELLRPNLPIAAE